tara:strand:+ start:2647 stop:2961 length:315 start_codon:yes stop_codon:yes gene_type:complete
MDKKNTAIISGSIELTAIDKSKIVELKNGKSYLNFTMKVQDKSQYGNNVWITHQQTKKEQDNKVKPITLGNAAVKWVDEGGISIAERNEVTNKEQNAQRVETPF